MSTFKIPLHVSTKLIHTLITNKVLLPEYKPAYNGESAGLDLFNTSAQDITIPPMVPTSTEDTSSSTPQELEKARLKTLIPTGLHIALPGNYVALLRERGSITKTPLKIRAGVIDPGYTGEIFVNMINTSNKDFVIPKDAKLPVQMIVLPVHTDYTIVTASEYAELTKTASRRAGKIGSSN